MQLHYVHRESQPDILRIFVFIVVRRRFPCISCEVLTIHAFHSPNYTRGTTVKRTKTILVIALAMTLLIGVASAKADVSVGTDSGIRLTFGDNGRMKTVSNAGKALKTTGAETFYIMEATDGLADVSFSILPSMKAEQAGDSANLTARGGGFEVTASISPAGDGLRFGATLKSLERRDRTVVLRWVLPVDCTGWNWSGGIGESHVIGASKERYANLVDASVRVSENGGINIAKRGGIGNGTYGDKVGMGEFSPYPLACVFSSETGIGAGIDLNRPVIARLMYLPEQGLVIEFDLGLSPGTFKFPNKAELAWTAYPVESAWGFRSAVEHYYALYPDCFEKRVEREGIWMPFTDITEVPGHQDFGFMFHETGFSPPRNPGDKTIADTDREIGVYSFVYVEPWDIQIAAAKDGLTYDGAVSAEYPKDRRRESIIRSVAFDPWNQWMIRLMYAPWFKTEWAVSYTTNPDPDLGAGSRFASEKRTAIDPALKAGFDGVYFDSWEFFWPFDLNYRSDHINVTDYPLSFSSSLEKPRPAIWHYASEYEMGRAIADSLHATGKLAMGNGFYNVPFTAGIMDLFGCEFEWPGNAGERTERWGYFRTMAAAKPIVVLLNKGMYSDAFTKEPYEGYHVYFNETLFWGVYPSFFSPDAARDPYWKSKESYETGRPYFKKYIPLIREVASAGWSPVTHAHAKQEALSVERFGPGKDGAVYFTVRSLEAPYKGAVDVLVDMSLFAGKTSFDCFELTEGKKVSSSRKGDVLSCRMNMKQGDTKVLRIR